MPDPAPFLSTIAAASAAMVAIIGGLLVARFVTIASEQEGAVVLLNDAQGRLTTARRREEAARDRLHDWNIKDFFDLKVVEAIGEGERGLQALRDIGDPTRLTDEELAEVIKDITDEFAVARSTLRDLLPADAADHDSPRWEEFKRSNPSLPATNWEDVWELAYEGIVRPPQPAHPSLLDGSSLIGTFIPVPYIPTPPEYVALHLQRRDALRANVERAGQQVEDIEDELARLHRARDAIVRPKGLGWGLAVLGFFTLVGVILPIWLMSRAPQRLTAHLGEVVFWLFLAGLLALLGYMSTLALRLSGWRYGSQL